MRKIIVSSIAMLALVSAQGAVVKGRAYDNVYSLVEFNSTNE